MWYPGLKNLRRKNAFRGAKFQSWGSECINKSLHQVRLEVQNPKNAFRVSGARRVLGVRLTEVMGDAIAKNDGFARV